MKTKVLTMEEWSEYANKGVDIPIVITLRGSSMEPLIRCMKDPVKIVPLKREPMVGDIVMFRRADGIYVAHRVYRVDEQYVVTWGDNCFCADAPLKREQILGLIVSLQKFGKTFSLDTDLQRFFGQMWMKLGRKTWLLYKRLVGKIGCYKQHIKDHQ